MMISVVICAYNPDEAIFKRVMSAIAGLTKPINVAIEIIIVDNNSNKPVSDRPEVKQAIETRDNIIVIVEKKPGLTNARLAGVAKARGEWVVFFDDDNEPAGSYLVNLVDLINESPQVGCWGPGVVQVEYIGSNINPWFHDNKSLFQEKTVAKTEFGLEAGWQDCYPFGTGLVVKKEIVEAYRQCIAEGKFSLTDRIGKKLVSGGDTQLVLQGIKMGFYAGTSPNLALHHLIAEKKLQFKYMLRQVYMTASCYVRAFNEIQFENHTIQLDFLNNLQILKILYSLFRIHWAKNKGKDFLILVYGKMGEVNARYFAARKEAKPTVLKIFEKLINV